MDLPEEAPKKGLGFSTSLHKELVFTKLLEHWIQASASGWFEAAPWPNHPLLAEALQSPASDAQSQKKTLSLLTGKCARLETACSDSLSNVVSLHIHIYIYRVSHPPRPTSFSLSFAPHCFHSQTHIYIYSYYVRIYIYTYL